MTTELGMAEPSTYPVYDGQRYVNVHGWHLASADTQQGTSIRWTEMSLYRAKNSARYVLEKIGRSDVYHSQECSQNSKGLEFSGLDAADHEFESKGEGHREFVACIRCSPGPDPRPCFVERDIYSVSIYDTAPELIESLFKPSSDKMRFLTRLGRELLSQASSHDDEIARLLQTPVDLD